MRHSLLDAMVFPYWDHDLCPNLFTPPHMEATFPCWCLQKGRNTRTHTSHHNPPQVCLMQDQKVAVAIVCALFGFLGVSIYPAVMELSVECSYPVGEATSAGLVFISGQVQSLIYIILLQALATPIAESPRLTCTLAPQSWKVPVMLLSALSAVSSCIFLIFFHTPYRRLEDEKAAIYGTGQGNGTAASENK
ncbi:solute carrier family 49 member A3-like [Nerophis ophidion]|uniref:solute carrier family 49 member A3-like n=1 Tax=Nerophis ophidion TaxID=159077 RepID=UPI002AE03F51|nr:solute carrier family 49 member A3-like [Nerophis ophidion]